MANININKDTIISALGIAAGLVGIGYGFAMRSKLSKVSERLDTSINDLADNMEIDVPDAIMNEAIEKAVTVEAKKAVQAATKEALDDLKRNIHDTVSAAVEKEYANIKDSVLRETTDAASKINVERVRKDIETAAHKQAMAKFNDNLDDILGHFNDNLNNVSRIYSSMASAATRSPDKEFTFKLN
jgi:hypothetical protein